MNITLCGSIAHFDAMQEAQKELEHLGHSIKLPPTHIPDKTGKDISVTEYYNIRKATTEDDNWVWRVKERAMRDHFEKVEWADAVLIINKEKNDIANYIGANTLLEMGVAFHLNKPIYLLNPIPDISYKEEILAMHPIVLHGDMSKLEEQYNAHTT